MSELPEQQQKVVNEAHAYRDAYNIWEERREIYQMVAQALLARPSIQSEDDFAICSVDYYAEAIYQGMLKFVGDKT